MTKADFQKRLTDGEAFEQELIESLKAMPDIVDVIENGTEHTHPVFIDRLRQNKSEQSKLLRFTPDGVFLQNDESIIHYDAKASRSIERDAYETYQKYWNMGFRIVIFVRPPYESTIYWQWLDQIRFLDSHTEVSKHRRQFPVDEDGWIIPRSDDGWYYGSHMSGTPFKYFDFHSFNRLDTASNKPLSLVKSAL
ncbi:MAG: hypothetical protein AB9903_34315 [Vulcanimicrobiota bacterium]